MHGCGFKMEETESWFSRAKTAAEETLPRNERVFGIGIVIVSVLMIIFFVSHQNQSTGFFNSKFGIFEILFFYGFWVFWITTAGLESIFNQRLLSRIVDTFGGVFFAAIAIAWNLVIFPFDFAKFSNILPESIRFLVQWISNDIAWAIMLVLMILHLLAAIYCPFAYKFVDKRRFKRNKTTNQKM
jgi:hypothetical protein